MSGSNQKFIGFVSLFFLDNVTRYVTLLLMAERQDSSEGRMGMIKSFRHKGLRRFFETGDHSGINPNHSGRLQVILDLLDAASVVEDMNFQGSNFHGLSGKLTGAYAVSVSGNWRVVFEFAEGDAFKVDYLDYH